MNLSEEKQNNLFLFAAAAATCSAIIVGILFVIIAQFSSIKHDNEKLLKDLEEIKELTIKNNNTLELIKLNIKN